MLALVSAFGIFVPSAAAQCTPNPGSGTSTDDTIVCDGTETNPLEVGTGTDQVTINGLVQSRIHTEGGVLTIIINDGGELNVPGWIGISVDGGATLYLTGDVTATGSEAIVLQGDGGAIYSTGDLSGSVGIFLYESNNSIVESEGDLSGYNGIYAQSSDNVTVTSIGDVIGTSGGIWLGSTGSITSTGDITAPDRGLDVGGAGSITSIGTILVVNGIGMIVGGAGTIENTGDITAGLDGIFLVSGSVTSDGMIEAGRDGIYINGAGSVDNTGNITAGRFGIGIEGGGTITSTGDVSGTDYGLYISGDDSTITSTGDVSGGSMGIYIIGNGGSITSTGAVEGDTFGITIFGSGNVTSTGTVTSNSYGIYIGGDGNVTSTGDLDAGYVAIYVSGNGNITSLGNIDALDSGIYLYGDGTIRSTGNINSGYVGIHHDGNGDIFSTGDINAYGLGCGCGGSDSAGIYLYGDGNITSVGNITSTFSGIEGGEGAQHVDVSGSISAPLAVYLNEGNDSLVIRSFTVLNGDVEMGDGDDIVQVENYAQVNGTMYGGEGAEVDGDTLIIGGGQVCAEDTQSVQDALAGLGGVSADAGTITYLGQTYTWAEFEHLAQGGFIAPCIGKINDGRINAYDLGAPEALYCTVENGVSVWELDLEGNGTFSFAVSKAQIEAAFATAVGSGVNTLIGSDSFGNELYALSDGTTITFVSPELREAGKQYLFSFERDTCG
jgi:hypothetical protein